MGIRENVVEGPDDRPKGCEVQLVGGDPLDEDTAARQMVPRRREVLARVQAPGAVTSGVEEITDDQVVVVGRSREEPAGIAAVEVYTGVFVDAAVHIVKPMKVVQDLGNELHGIDAFELRRFGHGTQCCPRSDPQEQGSAWVVGQHQGQVTHALFSDRMRASHAE